MELLNMIERFKVVMDYTVLSNYDDLEARLEAAVDRGEIDGREARYELEEAIREDLNRIWGTNR